GRPAVAGGRTPKSFAAIPASADGFDLHRPGASQPAERYPLVSAFPASWNPAAPVPLGPCLATDGLRLAVDGMTDIVFRFGPWLVRLAIRGASRTARVVEGEIAALSALRNGIVFVRRLNERTTWRVAAERAGRHFAAEVGLAGPLTAHFGFGGERAHAHFGLVAVGQTENVFDVWHTRGIVRIGAPAGAKVAGVIINLRRRQPGLVVVGDDDRTLLHIGAAWTRRLLRAAPAGR